MKLGTKSFFQWGLATQWKNNNDYNWSYFPINFTSQAFTIASTHYNISGTDDPTKTYEVHEVERDRFWVTSSFANMQYDILYISLGI